MIKKKIDLTRPSVIYLLCLTAFTIFVSIFFTFVRDPFEGGIVFTGMFLISALNILGFSYIEKKLSFMDYNKPPEIKHDPIEQDRINVAKYILENLNKGMTVDLITDCLVRSGFHKTFIEDVFNSLISLGHIKINGKKEEEKEQEAEVIESKDINLNVEEKQDAKVSDNLEKGNKTD